MAEEVKPVEVKLNDQTVLPTPVVEEKKDVKKESKIEENTSKELEKIQKALDADRLATIESTLIKVLKEVRGLKADVEILTTFEYERNYPSWKNKFINFLVAVFHTQPHEEEKESRRKTL